MGLLRLPSGHRVTQIKDTKKSASTVSSTAWKLISGVYMGSTISVVGNRFLSITDDRFFVYH